MWARVDDGWWCHPKVMGVSLPARGLWVSALSWSCAQRRDVVPAGFLAMVGGSNTEATELVSTGLWVECDDGWRIHDWAEYQEKSLSEKRADAGRKGGKRSGESRRARSNDEANADQATKQVPGPSRPVPSLPASGSTVPLEESPHPVVRGALLRQPEASEPVASREAARAAAEAGRAAIRGVAS